MLRSGFVAGLAALLLTFVAGPVNAQPSGPGGHSYQIEDRAGAYTVSFQRGGTLRDSRGGSGQWSFDGRTLCVSLSGREICEPWRDLQRGESYMSRVWSDGGGSVRVTRVA